MLLAKLGMASILGMHILAAVALVLCGFVGMSADTLIAQEQVVSTGLTERSFFKDFLIFAGVPLLVVAVGFWLLLKYGG